MDPTGRQAAPSVFELEGARAAWDEHPLASAEALIMQCMAVASAQDDHLLVISDADGCS